MRIPPEEVPRIHDVRIEPSHMVQLARRDEYPRGGFIFLCSLEHPGEQQ